MTGYIYNYLTETIDEEFELSHIEGIHQFSHYSPHVTFEDEETVEFEFEDKPGLGYNVRKNSGGYSALRGAAALILEVT